MLEEKTSITDANGIELNGKESPAEIKYRLNPVCSPDISVHSGKSATSAAKDDVATPMKKSNKRKKDRPKTSFFYQLFDSGGNSAAGGGGTGGSPGAGVSFDTTSQARRKSSTETITAAISHIMSRRSLLNSPLMIDDDMDASATQTLIPGTGLLKMASVFFRRDSHHSDEVNSVASSKHSVSSSRREKKLSMRKSFANVIRMSMMPSSMQPLSGPPSRNASFCESHLPRGYVRVSGRH